MPAFLKACLVILKGCSSEDTKCKQSKVTSLKMKMMLCGCGLSSVCLIKHKQADALIEYCDVTVLAVALM